MEKLKRQMKKKIMFFDLDGTLLDEQKRIVPTPRRAIKQLSKQMV